MIFKTMTAAAAIVTALALAPTAANASTVVYTNFETQGAASPGSYCYFGGGYGTSPCASGSVQGGGQTAGLQSETNTAWPGTPTPDGSYYGFIQSGYGTPGSLSQTLTLDAGRYAFSWLAAGRPGGGGNQGYTVTFTDSNNVTKTLYTGATTTNQAFTAIGTKYLTIGGNGTLSFNATDSGGDNAAFIDAIRVSSVPEPAVWGMMILGFGLIGATMRRRSGKLALA